MTRLPSIRARLARALVVWSVVWSVAVAAAVWLAARHEVDELLDDTLQASAVVLATLVEDARLDGTGAALTMPNAGAASGRFAWQVVGPQAQVLQRSAHAPEAALRQAPRAGFSDAAQWRVFGVALGSESRMLYVAQTRAERREAQAEVALSSVLAALVIGALGHLWLRARVRRELAPLQTLSDRLARHEPFEPGTTLGPAERDELQPMHEAIDDLGRRLAQRLAHERAFTAHAAHALRTPLAGIDAQLAVALRECEPALRPRLQRVRDASGRLQRVVAALLALFRTGVELQREPVDLNSLMARLPLEGLGVDVQADAHVNADPDLLSAALLNLLDNALRHGAQRVVLSVPRPGVVRISDDGPGVSAQRRNELQAALARQTYDGGAGLGLALADLVARAHGASVVLPEAATGFVVELGVENATA